jgi:hypothetical protein
MGVGADIESEFRFLSIADRFASNNCSAIGVTVGHVFRVVMGFRRSIMKKLTAVS